MKGTFIVLEGPDGSGTTTHGKRLAGYLMSKGHDVLLTSEPTEGPIGRFIRTQLAEGGLSPAALQLLFCADRAWHIGHVLLPALEEGKTIISDRYLLSTIAYGTALGLDPSWLQEVNKKFIQPDCQILLLPPLSVSMERLQTRASRDMLEEEDLQTKVHAAYAQASTLPNIHTIDSSGDVERVAAAIFTIVDAALSAR